MDRVLFARTIRAQRTKLIIVAAALTLWGALMPLVYSQLIDTPLGARFKEMVDSGLIPAQLTQFGGGNIFTLPGSVALGIIHPLAVAMVCVFAVGFAAAAVAGERQRGTLEVVLARPISRRMAYGSLFGAMVVFLSLAILAVLVGTVASSAIFGKLAELEIANVPLLGLNAVLLYSALGSVALAASVSFDRLGPALGIGLGFTVVSYFLEILGSLWPDAEPLQPFSVFHYLDPQSVLDGKADPFDFVVLTVVTLAGVAWSLVVFPRRDLAAPS
jgi:ABC-type transport system involved in multi-copper enzyme maturation permease subunit